MIKKDWVIILIITFIVIMAWVTSEIYHTRPSVQITPKLQEALEPINPTFDPTLLEKINALQKVNE